MPRLFHYERRRPEHTSLYQVVQEQLDTFLAQVEAQTGSGLPAFVKDEVDAFLECGILANGFVRLRCAECAHEKLVAFFCKRRGFCPSCGARRMAQTAAHLVDQLIPRAPVRQWVLSFPIGLRSLLAAHPELLAPALRIIHRVIASFLIKQARLKRNAAEPGAVTLIQRFGSAANLNIPLHCLELDGVYRSTGGEAIFPDARAPTIAQLQGLLGKSIARLMKMLTRQGYLVEEQGMTYLADINADNPLKTLQAASCTYRIALGPRAGHKVLSLRSVSRSGEPGTRALCANALGFSLHTGVRCGAGERRELERLCRNTRPALANERIKRNATGDVVLQLKCPWRDGTTHSVMARSPSSAG
jgi:Transposase zinc-binding domain/Putative transposase